MATQVIKLQHLFDMILLVRSQRHPGPKDFRTHGTLVAGMLHMLGLHVLHDVALLATVAAVEAGPGQRVTAGSPPHL